MEFTMTNQLNVFVNITETRQCTGVPDEATRRAWMTEGFEYKYGKWIRRSSEFLPLEMLKPVAAKTAA